MIVIFVPLNVENSDIGGMWREWPSWHESLAKQGGGCMEGRGPRLEM
jgi:hypothetical protein